MAAETFPGEYDVCDDCRQVVQPNVAPYIHVCTERIARLFPAIETASAAELKQSLSTVILLESVCERVHVFTQMPAPPGSPYVRSERVDKGISRFLIQAPDDRWGIGSTCMCPSCRPETGLAHVGHPGFTRCGWVANRIRSAIAGILWFTSPTEALHYVGDSTGAKHFNAEVRKVLNEVLAKRKLALETMRENA